MIFSMTKLQRFFVLLMSFARKNQAQAIICKLFIYFLTTDWRKLLVEHVAQRRVRWFEI